MQRFLFNVKQMEWRNFMCEDPAVKKSMLEADVHVKFLQSHQAGLPQYDIFVNHWNCITIWQIYDTEIVM